MHHSNPSLEESAAGLYTRDVQRVYPYTYKGCGRQHNGSCTALDKVFLSLLALHLHCST